MTLSSHPQLFLADIREFYPSMNPDVTTFAASGPRSSESENIRLHRSTDVTHRLELLANTSQFAELQVGHVHQCSRRRDSWSVLLKYDGLL